MSEFYSIITSVGLAKLAALPVGEPLSLTQMAFGNSTLPPDEEQMELHSEQHRCALTKVVVDNNNPECLVAEAIIKSEVGGFWIREIGIYDSDGDLFAIGKYPATYKPLSTEGSVKELGVRMVLRVSNADNVIVTYNNGIMDGAADTDLSNLTFVGQQKFNDKANIGLDNLTPEAQQKFDDKANIDLDNLTQAAQQKFDNKANTGLDNLNAQGQQKFDNKANLQSPAFTGTPTAPTATAGTNNTQLATTAFVANAVATAVSDALTALVNSAPEALDTLNELAEALGNDPSFAATVANQIGLKANIASPAFTGTPTAPTATAGTNTTQLATTAFVASAIATAITNLLGSAPDALNTLGKLASAVGNDASFSTTITTAVNNKASKTGDTITVANTDPTSGFSTRNIRAQTNDPGAGTALTNGQIILVYE